VFQVFYMVLTIPVAYTLEVKPIEKMDRLHVLICPPDAARRRRHAAALNLRRVSRPAGQLNYLAFLYTAMNPHDRGLDEAQRSNRPISVRFQRRSAVVNNSDIVLVTLWSGALFSPSPDQINVSETNQPPRPGCRAVGRLRRVIARGLAADPALHQDGNLIDRSYFALADLGHVT
jgi:hypothetical protein